MYPKIKALPAQFITFIVLIASTLSAQPTLVKKWDKSFGGVYEERFKKIVLMPDGGYLLAGESSSIASGNKSQSVYDTINYLSDIWLVRLDSNGNKLWDKQYGTTRKELIFDVIVLSDNTILIGAMVSGYPELDLTALNLSSNLNDFDYWVIKISPHGEIIWDRRYGGAKEDIICKMFETGSRQIVFVGHTTSNTSDFISKANKDTTLNSPDYWWLILDSLGNKIHDNRYGGFKSDYLINASGTLDGGYVLCGSSFSCAGGDVTDDCKSSTSIYPDIWVVKLDSVGNKEWDRMLGTFFHEIPSAIVQYGDSLYILIAQVKFTGQDVNQPSIGPQGSSDIWAAKLDYSGKVIEQFRIGGQGSEGATQTHISSDGNATFLAVSNSIKSGYKSEDNLADNEMWLISVDSVGNKLWDKTVKTNGGYSINSGGMVMPSSNCYTLATNTTSGIAGDKSTPNFDHTETYRDLWVIKYCFEDASNVDGMNEQSLRLFPNPTNSTLTIQTDAAWQDASVSLTNLEGKVVFSQALTNAQQQSLAISHLPNGMYFVTVQSAQQKWVRRVVKTE